VAYLSAIRVSTTLFPWTWKLQSTVMDTSQRII
jgi:hypothetical protein